VTKHPHVAKVCANCGALKADHIYVPGKPLKCPTTNPQTWKPKHTKRTNSLKVQDEIRDRLTGIALQARRARRISIHSDALCDAMDDLDNDLQDLIMLIDRARRADDEVEDGDGR
jgi:hypothetical protein